jgi:RNA polymerase sigma-70 factor (ECF subfamily)
VNDDPGSLQALRAAELVAAIATLRGAARRWSADWTAAEDLLQETLERAFRTLDGYRPGTSAGAWMRTIMYRLAVDQSRRQRRDRRLLQTYATQSSLAVEPLEHAEETEPPVPTLTELGAAAEQLREPFRTAFDMWANQGMSYLQISRALDVPVGTVATRLLRARRRLRTTFLGTGDSPGPHRQRSSRVRTRATANEPGISISERWSAGEGAPVTSTPSGRCRSPIT